MSSKEQEWVELDKDFKGKLPIKGQVSGFSRVDWVDKTIHQIAMGTRFPFSTGGDCWKQARVLKEDYDKAMEGVEIEGGVFEHPDSTFEGVGLEVKTANLNGTDQYFSYPKGDALVISLADYELTEQQAIEALQVKAEEVKKESKKGWWLCRHHATGAEKVLLFDGHCLRSDKKELPFRNEDWTRLHKMVEEKGDE